MSMTRHLAKAFLLLAVAGLVLAVADAAAALPRNDYLLVLRYRAGPFRYAETFQKRRPYPFAAATAAFGPATAYEREFLGSEMTYQPHTAGYCSVTWPRPGVTLKLFSFSGWWPQSEDDPPLPPIDPCSRAALATAEMVSLTLYGARWRTTTGIRIGGPIARRCPARNYGVPSSRAWGGDDRVDLDLCVKGGRVVTAIEVSVAGGP
jgi:hypothetical protein